MDCIQRAAEPQTSDDARLTGVQHPQNVSRPVGGYCLISVMQISMVWWAYKRQLIRWVDLRTWFASWELTARRCTLKLNEPRRYELSEFQKLVGGGGGESGSRASLRRLCKAGLLSWSQTSIEFAASPDQMPSEDLSSFWQMFENMPNRKRRVPLPRRMIRELAGGFNPVGAATILGYLLRCLYFSKHKGWRYDGTCKASWIAETFEVDERGVRRTRKHLAAIGWLQLERSEHWHRQRFGGRAVINRIWSRTNESTIRSNTQLPYPTAENDTGLPYPESEKELSSRFNNQEPTTRGPTGVCNTGGEKKKTRTMNRIEIADLKETSRTLALFDDAVERGLIDRGEHSRLMFVAAAVRAVMRGTKNPCGLFRRLIDRKLWHHITQGDEDAAHTRLKRHFYGDLERREPSRRPAKPCRIELSKDARFATAVIRALSQQNYRGDPFHVVMREYRDWTRERWGRAVSALDESRIR